ncbi:Glutathione S-transferase kappa [Paragonimus heterotremus]|uniref:Glutathione S-transferase kappa n=1 Tax=Paragonimus heterotremus TaxID=100268 RepID=A0A8J4T6Z2_9TREM|nr:Glutathione S-transferase kappa [Paragonimus heterotremus]
MKPTIHVYFDVVSPYSWIAFETSCRYSRRWSVDFRFVPAFIAGIMQATGNSSPLRLPVRKNYMVKDIERVAHHFQVPLKINDNTFTAVLEKGSLEAQRLLTAIAVRSMTGVDPSNSVFSSPPGGLLETVARRLWLRIWSTGEDITTDDNLRTVLQESLITVNQIDALLTEKASTSVKKALRSNTESALALGAFGLPIFHVECNGQSNMIFGSDRLPIIADLVGEQYLGPLKELSAFQSDLK